jgi:hypothetical protein
MKHKKANSKLNNELEIINYKSPTINDEPLFHCLFTNNSNLINKLYNFIISNYTVVNFIIKSDNIKVIASNENSIINCEFKITQLFKYFIYFSDFNFSLNKTLFPNISSFDKDIGLSIYNNEIRLIMFDKSKYFKNNEEWFEEHSESINDTYFTIPIKMTGEYYNNILINKYKNLKTSYQFPIIFEFSNNDLDQLLHHIKIDKNEQINIKYSKRKLYYNDEYVFKNQINNKIDIFSTKNIMTINKKIFEQCLTLSTNEVKYNKRFLFYCGLFELNLCDNNINVDFLIEN